MEDFREAPKHGDATGNSVVLHATVIGATYDGVVPAPVLSWDGANREAAPDNGQRGARGSRAMTILKARLPKALHAATGIAMLLAMPTLACSFDISFNSEFEPGKARLPAAEVRRMAEWMIDEPRQFENQEAFHIALYQAPGSGISPAMAHRRVAHLQGLLERLGVPAGMISSEIAPYRPGRSGLPPNFVQVNFMPGCPHPCCPGPQPIERSR